MFADSHAHLDFTDFDTDRQQVFERAREAGVEYMLAMGGAGGPAQLRSGLAIAEGRENVWATSGIHPHEAQHATEEHYVELASMAQHPRIVAIGEIGLDYHYDFSPRDVQQAVFRAQVRIAREHMRPVVIHTREADEDTVDILRQEGGGEIEGVLHCFTGGPAFARAGLDLGLYISLAGIITFPKAAELRQIARTVPLDRLLAETDSPFLAPVPHRGRRNEPAHVTEIAESLAGLHQMDALDLVHRIDANFHTLFRP